MKRIALLWLLATTAHADTVSKELAGKLAKAGWTHAELALTTPKLSVVTAKKAGKHHVVLVTAAGTIVDGGEAPVPARPTAKTGTITGFSDLIEVTLEHRALRPNDGADFYSWIWLVRADGSVACKLTGTSSTNTGTACGSGGVTNVRVNAKGTTVDVMTELQGTFSEKQPDGKCRHRSPVRSTRAQRYEVPAKGMCKEVPGATFDGAGFD